MKRNKGNWPILSVLMILLLFAGCASPNTEKPSQGSITPSVEQATTQTAVTEEIPSTDNADQDTNVSSAVKPAPVDSKDVKIDEKKALHCTITISAQTILNNMDRLDPAKIEVLPADGVIVSEQTLIFYEGESVFDVLLRATKDQRIHMEFTSVPMYNSKYIEGIGNLYEFDCGELSGWMYKVNGWFPNYGSSRYQLSDGDKIEWLYTCDLGRDIGGDWEAQKQ